MTRPAQILGTEGQGGSGGRGGAGVTPSSNRLWEDVDELLHGRPFFRLRLRGYRRAEVDEYVTWAEAELAAVRRQGELMLARYAACASELEVARRASQAAATTPVPAPQPETVSGRIVEILRLAADEADELAESAAGEADRLLAEARTEAAAWVGKARSIREAAEETLEQARREAAELLAGAAAERDRLAAEVSERLASEEARARQDRETAERASAAQLAAMQQEVADLRRQRDEAQESLQRLTAQIGRALQGVGLQGLAPAG